MTSRDPRSRTPIQERYATAAGDISFATLVAEYHAAADDERLAELIEADGRARLAVHRDVDLTRYLGAIPDLARRTVPLDAAIDVALRGLSRGPRPSQDAVRLLQSRFPELSAEISEAASLAEAIWSTTGLRRRVEGPKRTLPGEFGPAMPSGSARYELRQVLGSGGWGAVYLAHDRQLSEHGHEALVAIKLLTGPDRGPWARQRFIEEATKARRIDHPNVARILDRGVSDQDEDYLVYQYVPGGDLGRWLEDASRWPTPRQAAAIVAKIARGIEAAHQAGIVHCDLKPGNILMTASGEPLVADFGIAVRAGENTDDLLRGAGRPVGNLAFISPEQFRKDPGCFSRASDVYALGGLLHYLVTRQLPNGASYEEIARNHDAHTGRAQPPLFADRLSWIDQDLAVIGGKALTPDAAGRYGSAAALADDLEAWLRYEEIHWHRPSGGRSIAMWCRRRPTLALSAILTVVVALGGVMTAAYFAGKAADVSRRFNERMRRDTLAYQALGAIKATMSKVDHEGMLQDALPSTFLAEWLSGWLTIGEPENAEDHWAHRAEVVTAFLEDRRKSGLGDSVETLLWESTQGLYVLESGDYQNAEPLLRQNLASWKRRLVGGDDPCLRLIEHLIAAASVRRLKAAADAGTLTAEQRAEMESIGGQLQPLLKLDGDHLCRARVHEIAVHAYEVLCGPAMLNRPDDAARAKNLLALAAALR
jgi:hypothetical protein